MKNLYRRKPINIPLMTLLLSIIVACLLASCTAQPTTGAAGTPSGTSSSTPTGTPTTTQPTATPTQTSTTSPGGPAIPLTGIRMLANGHGWALTKSAILKTADSGVHWQDVTPANTPLNTFSRGDFIDSQVAWISVPQGETGTSNIVYVLHTTDGGKTWTKAPITTDYSAGTDMPHFISATEGWLMTIGSPGAGQRPAALYHTTDGGQHWAQLATTYGLTTGPNAVDRPSGFSYKDANNFWVAGDGGAGATTPTIPNLSVSHDGGKTWAAQPLPAFPGLADQGLTQTTPPVFFGNTGFLPVQNGVQGLTTFNMYVSHDGGKTWAATQTLKVNANYVPQVYVVDPQHAWLSSNDAVYGTSNGGQSWTKLTQLTQPFGEMSFIDASNGWAIGQTSLQPGGKDMPMLLHTTDGGKTWQQIQYSVQ